MTMLKTPTEVNPLAVDLGRINKTFPTDSGGARVLRDIDLQLPRGEMVFLVGPSGCGKTTLISIAAGILTADPGSRVTLFDVNLESLKKSKRSKFRYENIGFIFQQFNLVQTISVAENVAIPLLIQNLPFNQAIEHAQALLNKVGLHDKGRDLPTKLSGGQQQRVAIARALANNPRLLICDEPTSSLDSVTGGQVMELLKEIASDGNRCVIVVTHDHRVYHYADRMVMMEDGEIHQVLIGTDLEKAIQTGVQHE